MILTRYLYTKKTPKKIVSENDISEKPLRGKICCLQNIPNLHVTVLLSNSKNSSFLNHDTLKCWLLHIYFSTSKEHREKIELSMFIAEKLDPINTNEKV